MKRGGGTLAAAVLLLAAATWGRADDRTYRPDPPRDEFGLVPEAPHDPDLALPDPLLDRTWPGPTPGYGEPDPLYLDRDEEESDPFAEDEELPPLAPPSDEWNVPAEPEAPRPSRPLVGPDGRLDSGSPYPEANPDYDDPLGSDTEERSDMEIEESLPSPLDYGDDLYDSEMGDPGEW